MTQPQDFGIFVLWPPLRPRPHCDETHSYGASCSSHATRRCVAVNLRKLVTMRRRHELDGSRGDACLHGKNTRMSSRYQFSGRE